MHLVLEVYFLRYGLNVMRLNLAITVLLLILPLSQQF